MGIPLDQVVGRTWRRGGRRRRAPFFGTTKVAILGCTESIRYAPWTDPSWTLVAHNSARNLVEREPDYWMDLHPPSCFQQKKRWHPTYYTWLQEQRTPIFMQEEYPHIPAAVRYPKERILSEFRPFFTNQVAWIIALAMTEGVRHLGLYGCQYKADTEYGIQRESCVYWLGRFEGAGGVVHLPPAYNTLLCQPAELYGYESHDSEGALIPSYRAAGPAVETPQTIRTDVPTTHADIGEPVAWDRAAAYGIARVQ